MNENKLVKILKEIGLTDNEAKVYFISLSLGPSTVLTISKASGVKRTTTYSAIQSLQQRGLMNIELRGFKKLYTAESPEKLKDVLEQRKQLFTTNLDEFLALYNLKGGESFIKYHEGLESVKTVYEKLIKDIKPNEEYLAIGGQEQWYKLDSAYFQDFIERRAKLNLRIRLLFQDSEIAHEHKRLEQNYNEKVKILPTKTSLTTNMVITPQRVVIHQLTQPIIAIVIENKSIIQMQREMFEIIWNSL